MVVTIVSFQLPTPMALDQAAAAFEQTAPKYLGREGLVRKHYFVTEAGDRVGGVYFWKSKADAEACFTGEWREMVTRKYGVPPEIVYAHNPVIVDNTLGHIERS